jgi:hypothetical protein
MNKKSLASISAKNRKDKVHLNLTLKPEKSVLPPVKIEEVEEKALAPAAILIRDKIVEGKDKEDRDEGKEFVEEQSPLPDVYVHAASGDVKNVFYSVLNMFDTLYFVIMKSANICSKKVEVERNCLLECQHYGYCKVRGTIRDLVKQL